MVYKNNPAKIPSKILNKQIALSPARNTTEVLNRVGTGIFSYLEKCPDCGIKTKVDINGFCKYCYIEDIEKEMKGGNLKQ